MLMYAWVSPSKTFHILMVKKLRRQKRKLTQQQDGENLKQFCTEHNLTEEGKVRWIQNTIFEITAMPTMTRESF